HGRQGADVLLRAAHSVDTCACDSGVLRALRASSLDVRVAHAGSVSDNTAARVGLQSAGGLSDLGDRRRGTVSGVSLVCGGQAAAYGLVVELFVGDIRFRLRVNGPGADISAAGMGIRSHVTGPGADASAPYAGPPNRRVGNRGISATRRASESDRT